MKLLHAFIHPVKGMAALEVDALTLDDDGIVGDRRWMVVDANGKFISQRSHPVLATFIPALKGTQLALTQDDQRIEVPPGARVREVTVWSSTLEALDCGDEVAAFISARLQTPARLVAFGPTSLRAVNPKFGPGARTTFTDGYPLLLANEASLDALNAKLTHPVPMNRFRANLVVRADEPWVEDSWKRLRVDGLDFDGAKPCTRCAVINVDQSNGAWPDGPLPLKTLVQVHGKAGEGAVFGLNLVHRARGTLHVGAEVELISQ